MYVFEAHVSVSFYMDIPFNDSTIQFHEFRCYANMLCRLFSNMYLDQARSKDNSVKGRHCMEGVSWLCGGFRGD